MLKKYRLLILMILAASVMLASCKKDEEDPKENPPAAPVISDPLHVYGNYFYVNWIGVVGANGYLTDVATDQNFSNILPNYNNKEVAINGMFIVEGLDVSTKYYVRMRAFNGNGNSGNSAVKEFQTRTANLLPNMDMEEWKSYQNYESPVPEGVWTSANKVTDLNPAVYPVLLFKTEDAHSGNYAAKAVTNIAVGMPLLTGSLSTGIFHVDLNNPLESMIVGVPYKSRPTRFQGYYKYMGVGGDSCEIRTSLTKWNPNTKTKDKIGEAIYRTTDLVADYTFFDLEFEYWFTEDPDTIDMVFAASAGGEYFIGGVGSTIYIDDFTLIFE